MLGCFSRTRSELTERVVGRVFAGFRQGRIVENRVDEDLGGCTQSDCGPADLEELLARSPLRWMPISWRVLHSTINFVMPTVSAVVRPRGLSR